MKKYPLPIVYHPNVEKKYKLGVAVHFREWHLPHVVKFRQNHPEILFIDLGDCVSWTDIPDKICSCEAIASKWLEESKARENELKAKLGRDK